MDANVAKLKVAVEKARQILGASYSSSANRAGAYLALAEAYKGVDEGAYRQFITQMQITTYSNEIGGAAISGNLNAQLSNGPEFYNISLDHFSWDILNRLVVVHEYMFEAPGEARFFTQDEIQLADYSDWQNKGMGGSFPGLIQILDYPIDLLFDDVHPVIDNFLPSDSIILNDLSGDYIEGLGRITLFSEDLGTYLSDYGFTETEDTYHKELSNGGSYENDDFRLVQELGGDIIVVVNKDTNTIVGVYEKDSLIRDSLSKTGITLNDIQVESIKNSLGVQLDDSSLDREFLDKEHSPHSYGDPNTIRSWKYDPVNDRWYRHTTGKGNIEFANEELTVTLDEERKNRLTVQKDISAQYPEYCFLAGTLISMVNGELKDIKSVRIGDRVKAFDPDNPDIVTTGLVTQTYVNQVDQVLDFHGVKVTPGHAYFCGNGEYQGQFLKLIDIICVDGAVVDVDGQLVRAATNFPVGSREDSFVEIAYLRDKSETTLQSGRLRAGTRLLKDDGSDVTVLSCLEGAGYQLLDNGLVQKDGQDPEPLHWFGEPPKPEDYILKRSNLLAADVNVAVH